MKKVISLICILLLVAIEICIPLNSYAIEENENTQNIVENNNEIEQERNQNTNNIVDDNTTNEAGNNTDDINKVEENTAIEETEQKDNAEKVNEKDSTDIKENEIEVQSNEVQPRMNISGSELILDGTTNRITTKLTGRAVGTDGGSNENGADINLWDDISVSQQRFIFQYNKEGYYSIINEKSGKLLDVVGSGMNSGTAVDQWEDNGGYDNQKWIIQDAGNGYYNIISKLSGMYLTVNGTGANCDLLCVANKTGKDNQKFQIVEKGTPKGESTVEEGIYKIVLANAPTQSLTVDGGKTEDGANVHIWEYQKTLQQQFKLEYDGKGYYEIIPMHSGKRLDVVGYGNEANVDQWSENGGNDNQKWVIRKSKEGNYNIISKRDAMYLDTYQSKTANGTNIEVYEQSRGAGQEFKLEKIEEDKDDEEEIVDTKTVEEGTYKIVLANAPQQSLTVDGGKTEDGANVHIWEYVDSLQQQFNLVYDGNGYYEIIPLNSGKRLDVVGYGNEANVDQWSNNGGNDNQKWAIRKSASGNYNIVSKRDRLYLDAYQSKTANGTNIQVYEKSGGAGQEFKLEKIGDKSEKTVADGVYKISPKSNTNIVVEASASNKDNNGRVQIWENFNMIAQKLNIEYKNGYYKITMRHSGKSLTVKDNNLDKGVDILQCDYQGLDSQKWLIRDSGKGLVISLFSNPDLVITIDGNISNGNKLILSKNEYSNKQLYVLSNITQSERVKEDRIYRMTVGKKVVEASASNTDNNGRIQIWDDFKVDAQKLNFEYKEGYYKITMKHSEKSLTVKNNKLVEGADIVQYDYQGLDSQKWILRDCGKGLVISLLSNPDLSITVQGNIENGSKLILSKTEDNDNQIFQLQIAQVTIVINPGHGGSDPGCANGWIVEKNVTLDIAKKIQANLSKYSDVNVILTRTGDYYMDLAPRAMIARNNNADLYISLHINDEASHRATGSQMYVPFYEGTRHYNSNMTKLANLIQDKLGAIGIRENLSGGITRRNIDQLPKYQYLMDGKVVQADYYADIRHAMKGDTMDYGPDLNTNTGIPTILVEHCFMNSSDSQFLDSDYDLQRIANCDSEAIIEYFNL